MNSIGPNTNAPPTVLSADCILVCGEDRTNLLPFVEQVITHHAFRSYEFWKLRDKTVILSGMGTGCVEPLVWELAHAGIVRRIVLIGTAGAMPGAGVMIGAPQMITEAFLAGTALDGEIAEPIQSAWTTLPNDVPPARSVSTDFFYGFGPRILSGEYQIAVAKLKRLYTSHLERGTELVDMEVAQFYACCAQFSAGRLEYIAVKGASNELGVEGQQVAESAAVIERCYRIAERLLKAGWG